MSFQKQIDDNKKGRFVCPSDRQLALRAKLHTGWSTTKTASAGSLEQEEKEAIIKVVQRNEQLESFERLRVGKLVDRVERIKQRAAECGPRFCRLCGQAFGILGPSKQICEDCRKPVCTKCSIELQIRTSTNIREIWLCKICSETREMWKKTGAWFYKGIPKYELPSPSSAFPSKSISLPGSPVQRFSNMMARTLPKKTTTHKKVIKLGMGMEDTSSSEEEEEEEEEVVAEEIDETKNNDTKINQSDNITQIDHLKQNINHSFINPNKQIQYNHNNTNGNKLNGDLSTKSNSFNDWGNRKGSQYIYNRQNSAIDFLHHCEPTNGNNNIINHQQNHNNSNDWDTISMTGSIRKENGNGLHQNSTNSIRRGSVSSASWSMITDNTSINGAVCGGGSSTNNTGVNQQSTSMLRQSQVCREPPLGWLELQLIYTENEHTLDCKIVRARDLPPMDNSGLADPFCKINIITEYGTVKQKKWMQTKTVHKTINPEFNETVRFLGVEPEELGNSIFYVVLLDDDRYGNDFLGAAKINLGPIYSESRRMSVPLGPDDQFSVDAATSGVWHNGQILVSLCYNTRKRALIVVIKKCINLMAKDHNGFSDPFVKLQLKPDSHRHKKYKTSVKWRNLNPVFDEEFSFEIRPHDLDKQSLILTVWDKDIGKSNDFLGSLILGTNSKGRRLAQWKDCVRLPDYFHEQWHALSHELPNYHPSS